MRRVPRMLITVPVALALLVPSASLAYSEWPAISARATQLSLELKLPLKCCLEGHVGNIYLEGPIGNFGKFTEFLLELGQYLREHTNAGSYYLICVHFEDRVRCISIRDLVRFRNKARNDLNDPKILYGFFSLFRNE